jgi:hypothetical protein
MNKVRATDNFTKRMRLAFAAASVCALLLPALSAAAQDGRAKPADDDVLGKIGRWFEDQFNNLGDNLKNAGSKLDSFGREAGIAAKTTVNTAKDAADAVSKLPNARVMTGHEKCVTSPNGAPDCVTAANALCKAKGFEGGKSVDMTTAEVCPTRVWMSGRLADASCKTETFVSRALCQ